MAFTTKSALILATVAKVKLSYAAAGAVLFGTGFTNYEAAKNWAFSVSGSNAKDFLALSTRIDRWATVWARWAENGVRDDGSIYTLERWVIDGQFFAKEAWDRVGMSFDSSFFSDAAFSAKSFVTNLPKDLSDGFNAATSPTKWPWYLQAAVAGVGLFYASQIWANFRGKR